MLAVPYHRQSQDFWCWAACGQMLVGFFRLPNTAQCQFAEAAFHGGCCSTPSSASCNQGFFPENSYGDFGIAIGPPAAATDSSDLDGELAAGRPIEVTFHWRDGGAHVALVTGRYPDGRYEVHDPWFGQGPRALAEIGTGYGYGHWANSYLNLGRQ